MASTQDRFDMADWCADSILRHITLLNLVKPRVVADCKLRSYVVVSFVMQPFFFHDFSTILLIIRQLGAAISHAEWNLSPRGRGFAKVFSQLALFIYAVNWLIVDVSGVSCSVTSFPWRVTSRL